MSRFLFNTFVLALVVSSGCQDSQTASAPVPVTASTSTPIILAAEPEQVPVTVPEPVTIAKKPLTVLDQLNDAIDLFLSDFSDSLGNIDYSKLKKNRSRMYNLLALFSEFDSDQLSALPQSDQICFWLNCYNIQLTNIISRNWPIKSSRFTRLLWHPDSIRHISGIWSDYKFTVCGETFTLFELKKRFLDPHLALNPELMFAISRASASGSLLSGESYKGSTLQHQLSDQIERFLSSRYAFKIDGPKRTVYLSSMFQSDHTFIEKFGTVKKFKAHPDHTAAILNFICRHSPPLTRQYLELQNYRVKYLTYDWRINNCNKP